MGSGRRNKGGKKTLRNQDLEQRTQESTSRSPIQVLVPDILVEIFARAMLAEGEEFHYANWERVAPINVAAVCRHWRTLALALPSLWSTFRCSARYPYTIIAWDNLDTFLLRAQQAPLDIKIHQTNCASAEHTKLLKFISKNQSRMRNIDIKFRLNEDFALESQPLAVLSNLPSLEVLRLECVHFATATTVHLHLMHASRLRHLFLDGRIYLHLDRELALHNLVSVELSDATYSRTSYGHGPTGWTGRDCLMILQASPSIEVFRATGLVHVVAGDNSMNPTTESSYTDLPNLSTLKFARADHEAVHHVLDNLRLPGLKDLTLCFVEPNVRTCGSYPLLSRSGSVLEIFDLDGINIAEIIQCLESSPALRDLTISEAECELPEMGDLLECLTFSPDARSCPKLENITFNACGSLRLSYGKLETAICSRWDRSSVGEERSLETVTFRGRFVDLRGKLLKCYEEGLQILGFDISDDEVYETDLEYSDEWHDDSHEMYYSDFDSDWERRNNSD